MSKKPMFPLPVTGENFGQPANLPRSLRAQEDELYDLVMIM